MTNPGDAVGTNGAYGGRTSVNAFNDVLSAFSGRGIIQGWNVVPGGALNVKLGGLPKVRDMAIAENDLGQRTTINNISNQPITVELEAAPTLGSRIDTIVAYVNNPPDAIVTNPIQIDNPSVCGLIIVPGNVSNNPVTPDETMIRAAITADGAAGSTAYYVVLGTVAISTGMTTVTQSNITQGASSTLGAAGIANNSVTTPKLADGAVDSSKLAQGAVKSENVDWATMNDSYNQSRPIGQWVDGKIIYRRPIYFTLDANGETTIDVGALRISSLIKMTANISTGAGTLVPLPSYFPNTGTAINIYANGSSDTQYTSVQISGTDLFQRRNGVLILEFTTR